MRRVPRGLALNLGVQLGAEQDSKGGQVEPGHQQHYGAENPESLLLGPEPGDVGGEPRRTSQPQHRGDGG